MVEDITSDREKTLILDMVNNLTKSILGITDVYQIAWEIVNNIAELIGNKSIGDRSIAVHIDGATVSIDVKVNISYGAHVPTVASSVQSAVVSEVEKITGMTVTAVNVVVQELDDSEDDVPSEDEE